MSRPVTLIIIASREICGACNEIRNARKRVKHHERKAARAAIKTPALNNDLKVA